MFLMATLVTGRRVVSEFAKLAKVQKYVNDVFSGAESFNAWKIVARVHPTSGEETLIREREMISGKQIVSIQQVVSLVENHGYLPDKFAPARLTKEGEKGLWRAPHATTILETDGVVVMPGVDYPLHRDPHSLRDFVILRAGNEAEEIEEVRYFIDGRGVGGETHVGSGLDDGDNWNSDDEEDDEE